MTEFVDQMRTWTAYIGVVLVVVLLGALFAAWMWKQVCYSMRKLQREKGVGAVIAVGILTFGMWLYGSVKFVAPLEKVEDTVTENGVSFAWSYPGEMPSDTSFIIEYAPTNSPDAWQELGVTSDTSFEASFANAQEYNYRIRVDVPDTNVVDVVGITLYEVTASSGDVKLRWEVSDGNTNQTIHVLYRDKTRDAMWVELAVIDGATNITVNGFFIDRDTEWKVNTQGVENVENEDN